MGVSKYAVRGKTYWKVDEWVVTTDGIPHRIRKSKIPTREQAMALAAKLRADAFEGRFFDRPKTPKVTVRQLWEDWKPISETGQGQLAQTT